MALSIGYGATWEHQHDEGLTFDIIVGDLTLPVAPAAATDPTSIYAQLEQPHSASEVIERLRDTGRMPHPPGYYLLLNTWAGLVGTQPLPLRIPAYVLGILFVLGMGLLGRQLTGSVVGGRAAMLVCAVSPWVHALTNFLRPYALANATLVWATIAVLAQARPGAHRGRARVAFVLLSAIGLYTVYPYAYALAWHGLLALGLAWRSGSRTRVREITAVVLMGAAILLLFAPWIPSLARHLDTTGTSTYFFSGSVAPAEWPTYIGNLLHTFGLGEARLAFHSALLLKLLIGLSGFTALALIAAFTAPARPRLDDPARALWATLAVLPLVMAVLDASRGTITIFIAKYNFAIYPFLLLGCMRALTCLPWRALGGLGMIAWVALFLGATCSQLTTTYAVDSHHEALARTVAAHDVTSHTVALSSSRRGQAIPLVLSMRDAGVARAQVVEVPRPQLLAFVKRTMADPTADRLTLANLVVQNQTDSQTWYAKLLAQVRAAAKANGWGVHSGLPGGEKRLFGPDDRIVWIATPVFPETFVR